MNGLENPYHSEVYMPMDRKIHEYFIDSSHNTYLRGHQLKGESHPVAYQSALLRGCRCVELDCWDGEGGEPIVFHGYTLTTKVRFADCIKKIRDTAFVTSSYPVILSLEIHCTYDQQVRMAQIMIEKLGNLLKTPFEPNSNKPKEPLTPESLKSKVLIKVCLIIYFAK